MLAIRGSYWLCLHIAAGNGFFCDAALGFHKLYIRVICLYYISGLQKTLSHSYQLYTFILLYVRIVFVKC